MAADTAVVPSYEVIYGQHCTMSDLASLLGRFGVVDWLCTLAQLGTLLCGDRHRGGQFADAFLSSFVPPDLRPKLGAFFAQAKRRGGTAYIFSERHIGILIELALRYARRAASETITSKAVVDALLMLVELEPPPGLEDARGRMTPAEAAAVFSPIWERSMVVAPSIVATRGFHLFQIGEHARSPSAKRWHHLFGQATGRGVKSYFAGGLCMLALEYVKEPQDIAQGWSDLPLQILTDDGKATVGVPQTFQRLKCRSIARIAREVEECERSSNPNDFNLITLNKHPLVRLRERGVYPLYLPGIAASLCEGIYHEVLTASLEHRIPEPKREIGGVFGLLFQEYVLTLLSERFGKACLMKTPRRSDDGNEAADAIVICPEGIIAFQIKGCHVPVKRRFEIKGTAETEQQLLASGLRKATCQLVRSIECIRKGLVSGLGFQPKPETFIQPVVVTYEQLPLFGLAIPWIEEQRCRAKVDAFTRPLVMLSVTEIEHFCSLPGSESVWDVLTDYISRPYWLGRCFYRFLGETRRRHNSILEDRWRNLWPQVRGDLRLRGVP